MLMLRDGAQDGDRELTRSVTEQHVGIWMRSIYGLNVFAANKVATTAENDPRYRFVKHMAAEGDAYIHVDCWMLNELWTPADEFIAAFPSRESRRTGIGITQDTFYAIDHGSEQAIVSPWASDLVDRLDPRDVCEAMKYDALCVYTGVRLDRLREFLRMFESPFPGSDEWIRQATELCECMVLTCYDAWGFVAYARDRETFKTLETAIDTSEQLIRNSNWYIQHRAHLCWEDEEDKCLKPAGGLKPVNPDQAS